MAGGGVEWRGLKRTESGLCGGGSLRAGAGRSRRSSLASTRSVAGATGPHQVALSPAAGARGPRFPCLPSAKSPASVPTKESRSRASWSLRGRERGTLLKGGRLISGPARLPPLRGWSNLVASAGSSATMMAIRSGAGGCCDGGEAANVAWRVAIGSLSPDCPGRWGRPSLASARERAALGRGWKGRRASRCHGPSASASPAGSAGKR